MKKSKRARAKPESFISIDKFNVAERVKYLRNRREFTQAQLAKTSGVSQSTVAQIESGGKDPSMTTLKKLCQALNVDIADLFAGDDVHVFNMTKLRKKYKSASELPPARYKAFGEVIRLAKELGFEV